MSETIWCSDCRTYYLKQDGKCPHCKYRIMEERLTAELNQALEKMGRLDNLHKDAESKLASITQELEDLRAGYAGAVEAIKEIITGAKFAHSGDTNQYSWIICICEEALSSTPQSVKDVMDVLEAAKEMRGLLLFALWHHQGGSSEVGQPIRKFLGIGEYDHLTQEQIAEAKEAVRKWEAK